MWQSTRGVGSGSHRQHRRESDDHERRPRQPEQPRDTRRVRQLNRAQRAQRAARAQLGVALRLEPQPRARGVSVAAEELGEDLGVPASTHGAPGQQCT